MKSQTPIADTLEVGYDEFCGALASKDLQALWKLNIMQDVPLPATRPWLWKWDSILPLAQRAGELITLDRGGDRRVLALANPGLGGLPFTSTTLWGAIQYLRPGETAPAHRHTPAAIRFVMRGSGAYTTVNGDRCDMEPGDLILTPNWNWHDHNNDGTEPMVWFDGLDLPLVTTLESIFFEFHPDRTQPIDGRNESERDFRGAGLRPLGMQSPPSHSPLLRYTWAATDEALESLHEAHGGTIASVEFVNPLTGAPAVATFACEMHRVYPGQRAPSRRKTGSSVYVVFRGSGTTVIDGEAFEWSPGDIFVTPSWALVDHMAHETADLFAISDRPVIEFLHLYREEELPTNQEIVGAFSSR